ncbi:Aste57867_23357 [Aphanomyces stellatus]|uniref:Aste57867_23357 protein n=1 Tax=Aphanomyces stellatus TaxID=120398 RepID=A0A485LMW0_9STRA|nr:hypothetical protein As57867_023286 [Aphanomyces stellatus]VFU00003.1 Aste57867_23357 [Aphanomyces stellatus]
MTGTLTNEINQYGETPLHFASLNGHLEVIEFLLSTGASIDQVDNYGETPLQWASRKGHLEIVRELVDAGASLVLVNNDGNTAKDLTTRNGHSAVAVYLDEAVAKLRLSVAKALTGNKIDKALATLSRVVPRTGCQNATVLVYRAVAYISIGEKECAWKDARACIDLEILSRVLESTDTEFECFVTMKHIEMSKRVAVAFDASMMEITNRLTKDNPAMLEWLTVPENRNTLQEVKSSPYKFKATHARMEEALKILEDAMKQDHPNQIAPEPPGTSDSELGVALSLLRIASQDVIIRVLKPEFMTPHLARNPDTVLFLGNSKFHQMLQNVQNNVEKLPEYMNDLRMCKVLLVLLGRHAPSNEIEKYLCEKQQSWTIFTDFKLCEEIAKANH